MTKEKVHWDETFLLQNLMICRNIVYWQYMLPFFQEEVTVHPSSHILQLKNKLGTKK